MGGGGGGRSLRPVVKGDPVSPQKFFWHFGPQFGPKIRGLPAPCLDPPLGLLSITAYRVYQRAFPKSRLPVINIKEMDKLQQVNRILCSFLGV